MSSQNAIAPMAGLSAFQYSSFSLVRRWIGDQVAITSSFSTQTRSISLPSAEPLVFSGKASTDGLGSVGASCTGQRSHL